MDWYLRVLPLVGVPTVQDFVWLPKRAEIAAGLRRQWPVDEASWLLVQPGARWSNKRWPLEHFAELLRMTAAWRADLRFAILGGAEDRGLAPPLVEVAPRRCVDLTGCLSLPEMVEWLRAGALLVTNDTGPMHVAAALGRPVVALFGPTEPRRTGPYGQIEHALQMNLPCVPCLKSHCNYSKPIECLRSLSPAAAFRAVQARLA